MKRYTTGKRSVKASDTVNTFGVPENKLHADYVQSFVHDGDTQPYDYVHFIIGMLRELDGMQLSEVFEFTSKFFTTKQLDSILGPCMDELGWSPGSAYTLQDFVQDKYGN